MEPVSKLDSFQESKLFPALDTGINGLSSDYNFHRPGEKLLSSLTSSSYITQGPILISLSFTLRALKNISPRSRRKAREHKDGAVLFIAPCK